MAPISGNGVGGSVLSGSVWTGGMVPGVGDTSTFSSGVTYTLASGATWRVGDSANPATHAIRAPGTGGTSVFNFDGTLELLGNVLQGNANWTGGAGCAVKFDHASTALTWQIGDAHSQNKRLSFAGSQGSPCTVTSISAATGSFTSAGFFNCGVIQATHTDFSWLGGAATNAMTPRIDNSGGQDITFSDCTFRNCGRVENPANAVTNRSITFVRCEFEDCTRSDEEQLRLSGTASLGTGQRLIDDCSFKDANMFTNMYFITLRDTVFHYTNRNSTSNGRTLCVIDNPSVMLRVAIRHNQQATIGGQTLLTVTPRGAATTYSDCYFSAYNQVNPHGFQITAGSMTQDITCDGFLFHSEYGAGDGTGDMAYAIGSPAAMRYINLTNAIGMQQSDGYNNGCFWACSGNHTNLRMNVLHCTFISHTNPAPEGCLNVGDAQSAVYNGGSYFYDNVKSVLVRAYPGAVSYLFTRYGNSVNQQDAANPAGVQNIFMENPASTTDPSWITPATSAFFTVPVTGPVYTGNPHMTDPRRDHRAWDAWLGGAGTGASAFARLCKKTTRSGKNTNTDTVASMLFYVRLGQEPRNPYVRQAHDTLNGGTIGATNLNSRPRLRNVGIL